MCVEYIEINKHCVHCYSSIMCSIYKSRHNNIHGHLRSGNRRIAAGKSGPKPWPWPVSA